MGRASLNPINENNWNRQREVLFTWLGVTFTLFAVGMVGWEQAPVIANQIEAGNWPGLAAHAVVAVIVLGLIYGGLVYQFARLGYIGRLRNHQPAADESLERLFYAGARRLTILVPSYKEDHRVIVQTLLSAAFQEYPDKRLVLLIDDPPNPAAADDRQQLSAARAAPAEVAALLAGPRRRFEAAFADFEHTRAARASNSAAAAERLAALWEEAAAWFEDQVASYDVTNHTDRFFVDAVLRARVRLCRARAVAIRTAPPELEPEYRRLVGMFTVEVSSFERKRYVNLSHEANKAMNLNSYLALLGCHLRAEVDADGMHLKTVAAEYAEFSVPHADYVITLDADSLLLPEYALRLIELMERPGNERLAVAQTPYSAIPGAHGALERIAGATTDIQYIIHQGFTRCQATFWVGANALLRRTALEDIEVIDVERGYPIRRYIQDRTVIEDTESSVDLVERGWWLYNYPQRLAYSATPPDFGSLIIQRRRWANGGLIILPKLLRYLARGPQRYRKVPEAFMRIHYLGSIAAVNIGLLILLAVPFSEEIESLWLPLTALPYFVLYARDLALSGYCWSDLFRVYALNLLLLPVNLGGVLKSLQQAYTGMKIPFGRTPKVQNRTAAAPLYIGAIYLLLTQWITSAAFDLYSGHWAHAALAFVNAAFLFYAIAAFVGFAESKEDLRAGVRAWRRTRRPVVLPTSSVVALFTRRRRAAPALPSEVPAPVRVAEAGAEERQFGT